ncbi:DNA topoisomerase IV subunit A, partial [Sporichthya sp.]|uniref:DNA gyrase/topoisomerase IV subunit A n=1 Tax=Sporichthya sp. TaxID=65475 RepID=UPI0017FBA8ED
MVKTPPPPAQPDERIIETDVSEEMRGSFLEYAYSVIYSRALPDARDGLKPVHRRILYQMADMGLRPENGHVKSARVVGEVMGKLHPHGDGAIYDALVRMAQPLAMRLPLIDGHGNFGSYADAPAAMRYTECRLDAAAMAMVEAINEDTVDLIPSYDGSEVEPVVLPAAFPNLLVNGAAGIAVGMATNMAPHNLGEVIAAARHLIKNPEADLDDLMRFVPGPDLPTGGKIIGLDGIREAYETGRGTFRTRATTHVENLTPRKKAIVVDELPFGVDPERVVAKISELVRGKRLAGIADVADHTDKDNPLRLVIEIKSGFVPEAVLEQLYKLTPMEDSFGINNVALVDGQPLTLGLKELLQVYLDHRFTVVRRRSAYRRGKAADRLHLVDGLLVALLNIDEVIQVIRTSDDAATAKTRLMEIFELTDIQATYILDTPLRRLTRLDKLELEREAETLRATIAELDALLNSDDLLRALVSDELGAMSKKFATPRRTVLLESAGMPATAVALEVTDDPCWVLLSATGLLARTPADTELPAHGPRAKHDVIVSAVKSSARGHIGALTSAGRMIRLPVIDMPAVPITAAPPALSGGGALTEFVRLEKGETIVALASLEPDGPILAIGTAQGVVKRLKHDVPSNKDDWEVIALKDGDRVVGAGSVTGPEDDLVFVTTDAQMLRFPADRVSAQGRTSSGMAGITLTKGARALWFGVVDPNRDGLLVTIADNSGALDVGGGSVKVTPYQEYPTKGRGTGGVRCQRFV